MKHKFMKFTLLFSLLVISFVSLSSFIATDEGDSTKYSAPVGKGCTAICYWTDNQGHTQQDGHAGTITNCQSTTTVSSCTPKDCTPLVACPPNQVPN